MGQGATLRHVDDSIVLPGSARSYSGSSVAFSPPATPTDLFYIAGAAGVIVKIWKLWFSTVQTTAGVNSLFLVKRSTANSGGTPVATTKIPLDSNDAAAQATVQHYTANPTPGTAIGNIWSGKVNSPAPGTAGIGGLVGVELDFSALFGKPVTLRSAAEGLALSFDGAVLPTGLSVISGVRWSEEG